MPIGLSSGGFFIPSSWQCEASYQVSPLLFSVLCPYYHPFHRKEKPRFLRPSSFTNTKEGPLNKPFWVHIFRFTLIKPRKCIEDKEKRGKASNEASQVGLGAPVWHTASHRGSVCTLLWGFQWWMALLWDWLKEIHLKAHLPHTPVCQSISPWVPFCDEGELLRATSSPSCEVLTWS